MRNVNGPEAGNLVGRERAPVPAPAPAAPHAAPHAGLVLTRRDLLISSGIAGAVAAVTAATQPARADADVPAGLEWLLEQVARPALDLLAYETFAGLAVFAVPGPDRFSRA